MTRQRLTDRTITSLYTYSDVASTEESSERNMTSYITCGSGIVILVLLIGGKLTDWFSHLYRPGKHISHYTPALLLYGLRAV